MNITIKQLLDIVSLSIEAVNTKADPTVTSHKEEFFFNGTSTALVTPVENEVSSILGEKHDLKTKVEIVKIAKVLNGHIAAIRLGMKLRENE